MTMKRPGGILVILLMSIPAAALGQSVPDPAPQAKPAVPSTRPLPRADAPAPTASPRTMDRLELDPTAITGNRELPKVMVIVPWKPSEAGDLQGLPFNSLLNEVLTPVDRDVFQREVRYHHALEADRSTTVPAAAGASSAPGTKPET